MTMTQAQVGQVLATEAHGWCAARGLSRVRSLYVVLASNAWGESAWNPRAKQPGGGGRGLFQTDVYGGLGLSWLRAGGTEEQLYDASINTRLILWEAGNAPDFIRALRDGTLADAIREFVYDVERPRDKPGDTSKRQRYAVAFTGGAPVTTPCRTFG